MKLETFASHGVHASAEHSPLVCLKKIFVPVDFSPASEKAFTYALRFAQEFRSEWTLLHVLEPATSPTFAGLPEAPVFFEKEFSDAETNFRALMAAANDTGVKSVRWTVRTGLPAHEIIEAAKDTDVDLIVIATHGFTGWKHFCIGSTAERVARAAPCPVLVVREKEHEFI